MSLKEKVIEQVCEFVEAPVTNCRIGVLLKCHPYEIREALKSGKCIEFRRKNGQSCGNFSTQEVKIYYNEDGDAIDYALPYCDPEVVLKFTFTAGLVDHGSDFGSLWVGTGHQADGESKWERVEQGFNDLVYQTWKMNRSFFPPDPIFVGVSRYEVFCLCRCDNHDCSANAGEFDLVPRPFISEEKT